MGHLKPQDSGSLFGDWNQSPIAGTNCQSCVLRFPPPIQTEIIVSSDVPCPHVFPNTFVFAAIRGPKPHGGQWEVVRCLVHFGSHLWFTWINSVLTAVPFSVNADGN